MSLDFDAGDLVAENGRLDFPVPAFVALAQPFGWTTAEYYDGGIQRNLTLPSPLREDSAGLLRDRRGG
jgi:hypothetical protein